jgi:hypothetical protein
MATPERTLQSWHHIFGHLSPTAVKQVADKKMVSSMKMAPSSSKIEQCTTCIEAKQHVKPFPKQSQQEYTDIGDNVAVTRKVKLQL